MSSNGVLGVQGDPSALPALKNVQSIGFLIHLYCTNFCTGTMVVPMVVPVYRRYGTISKCATLVLGTTCSLKSNVKPKCYTVNLSYRAKQIAQRGAMRMRPISRCGF